MNYTLITGASSGIGRASAQEFAAHNHNLILCARRKDRLEAIKSELGSEYGIDVQCLSFDIRDYTACKDAINSIKDKTVEILINNAGLAQGLEPIHEGIISDWETMIDTNLKGLLYITRLLSPTMVKNGRGHIINTASTAGKRTYPGGNVYCATKHAVDALTRAMRRDLYKYGIRVSQVAPGAVEETEFAERRFHGDREKARIYDDYNPLKAKDVAEVIYFIASRPPHVNIQDILLMGTQQVLGEFDRSGRRYDDT